MTLTSSDDLDLTESQRAFREEVRAVLRLAWSTLPAEGGPGDQGAIDAYRLLGERGLLAPNWPTELGGAGLTMTEKCLVTEELIDHGFPDVAHTLSVDIVGLAIREFGSPDQQQRWLPPLAAGTGVACVLLSEPDVGSDLAALAARGTQTGDGWRLTGEKVYSVKAQHADVGLCAVRTSPGATKYQGITAFLVPFWGPGVVVEPLPAMSDERFNRVYLDGVVLGPELVLGEVDDGWNVITQLLDYERTGIEFAAKARRLLDLLHHEVGIGAEAELHAPDLVALDARVRAARLMSWRAVDAIVEGRSDSVGSAMAKLYASEAFRQVAELAADVLPESTWRTDDPDTLHGGLMESMLRDAPGTTLGSGTSQMMLSLIASTGLEVIV